jgi:hypothetical protein
MTVLEMLSAIIAACCHDVGHGALTNRYLVLNKDKLAVRYNDSSVLESMHSAYTYKILQRAECNIFANLSEDEWTHSRQIIIDMILQTDMSKHFDVLGRFKLRASSSNDIDLDAIKDRLYVLGVGLKCADVGHSAKIQSLHRTWTNMVCEEFFSQGDMERTKGQPISMFCDRETTNIPKSQHGFLTNICIPLYDIWCNYLKDEAIIDNVLLQLKRNAAWWLGQTRTRHTSSIQDMTKPL